MKETFEKINDYTLRVDVQMLNTNSQISSSEMRRTVTLSRVFNFEAAQVTTIGTSATVVVPRQGYSGGAGVSDTMDVTVTDFADLSSTRELERMHAKLRDLGGTPPVLDEVLGGLGKKAPGLSPRKNG